MHFLVKKAEDKKKIISKPSSLLINDNGFQSIIMLRLRTLYGETNWDQKGLTVGAMMCFLLLT